MEARSKRINYVIGVEKGDKNCGVILRILKCNVEEDKERQQSQTGMVWNFGLAKADANSVKNMIETGREKFINVTVSNGALYGSTGSLDRFKDGADIVIISKILECGSERVLGYRVANSNGKVWRVKEQELINVCKKAHDSGIAKIQNAMYVESTANKKAHIREFVEDSIVKEYISNNNAEVKVNTKSKSNNETKSVEQKSLSDAGFTKEQIEVLRKAYTEGLDIKKIVDRRISADAMRFYVCEIRNKADISKYLSHEYSVAQLMILSEAYDSGVDMSKLKNPSLTVEQMQEIYVRLSNGIWSVDYTGDIINAEVIK